MRDKHEPSEGFVDQLEWQITGEVRRRNRAAEERGPAPRLRLKRALALAAVAIVSMVIGGAAVAAAYQAQSNEQRDRMASRFELRLNLSEVSLAMTKMALLETERRVAVGAATNSELLDARAQVIEAEAVVRSGQLQLEEVRITGREPATQISAPLVSGRDFVSEAFRIALLAQESALQIASTRFQSIQSRVAVGATDSMDAEVARARVIEGEVTYGALRKKLEIRERFLKNEFDAARADLLVLQAEAEQRRQTTASQMELAKKEVQRQEARFKVGMATAVELAEVTLRLQKLEMELAKAQLDLAVIQRQLSGR